MGTTTKNATAAKKPAGRPKKTAAPQIEPEVVLATARRKGDALEEALFGQLQTVGTKDIVIPRPNFQTTVITIRGTTPLVLHNFAQKSIGIMRATQEAGSQGKKGKKREARDFEENFQGARHISTDGWDGFPASAVRCAMISACRTVGFKMTLAKLSVFCVADGFSERGTPLVRITKGEPKMDVRPARNANGGTDLRSRPMWQPGWEARVHLRWDGDQFSATDIANLLMRAGTQVGLGEGRPDSRMSAGIGWGEFELVM